MSRTTNQPVGCEVFYEVDIRMRNKSFFMQLNSNNVYTKVFQAKDALNDSRAQPVGMTFALNKSDASVPWRDLAFRPVEPGELAQRYFRVKTVNGNGFSQGWGAESLVPVTVFP